MFFIGCRWEPAVILVEACCSCRSGLGHAVSRVEELTGKGVHGTRSLVLQHLLGVQQGAILVVPPNLGRDWLLATVV